jgi:hypothetical protein
MESPLSLSDYPGLIPVATEFVLHVVRVGWPEIVWAYEMHIIGWRNLTEFAKAGVDGIVVDNALSQLANLTKEEASNAGDLARSLAAARVPIPEVTIKKKWLYVLLRWLHERKQEFPDPLGLVEQIYTDFGYPEEIEGLVRWMPSAEPVQDREEGLARIEQKWMSYLERSEKALQNPT